MAVKIRYVGPFDAVEVDISPDNTGRYVTVQRNHQIEVPDEIAHGIPARKDQLPPVSADGTPNFDYDPGRGGLLEQTDNWALVEKPAEKAKE